MKGHGEIFTRKRHQAIMAPLEASTVDVPAARCGVSASTLMRWMKRPDFQETYRQARGELVERSLSSLQTASIEALEALKRNVACGPPSVEVRTAPVLPDQSLSATELAGLEARFGALEDTGRMNCLMSSSSSIAGTLILHDG